MLWEGLCVFGMTVTQAECVLEGVCLVGYDVLDVGLVFHMCCWMACVMNANIRHK